MATLIKIKTTRPLPLNAEIVMKDGKEMVRIQRNGRSVLREVLPDGKRFRDESSNWYVQYRDANGKRQRQPAFTDKEASRQLAAEIKRRLEREQVGLIDEHRDGKRKALTLHLKAFEQHLNDKGDSPKHIKLTRTRIEKAAVGCRFVVWNDIDATVLQRWLAEQRSNGEFGAKTSNYYQSSFKEFCTWLESSRSVPSNPLRFVQPINCETDVRRQRRSISSEEFERLVAAATVGPEVQCMAGPDRAILYILAAWTGLRRQELASLTTASFELDSAESKVIVDAAYSKRRRKDVIPLHSQLVAILRSWFDSKRLAPKSKVFNLIAPAGGLRRTSKMMQLDLADARKVWIEQAGDHEEKKSRKENDFLTYEDDAGLFADFHANRHTFITNLVRSGVTAKLAQTLARHSDPRLTLNIYTHVDTGEQIEAIEQLPALPVLPKTRSSSGRPGDQVDSLLGDSVAPLVAPFCDIGGQNLSQHDAGADFGPRKEPRRKLIAGKALGTKCHSLARGDLSSGGGTRNSRRFPGENLRSRVCWGFTGDNSPGTALIWSGTLVRWPPFWASSGQVRTSAPEFPLVCPGRLCLGLLGRGGGVSWFVASCTTDDPNGCKEWRRFRVALAAK